MPFIAPDNLLARRTRVHINGETYTGKTSALLTFPAPRFILNYPGEGGYDTLPTDDPDTLVRVWTPDKVSAQVNSAKVLEDVWQATVGALKTPGLQTFAGDGLHKLMAYVMDAMSGGAFFEGAGIKTASASNPDTLDPRAWGQSERWMTGYLNMVKQSSVPVVVFTSWDADKQERRTRQGEKWTDVPTKKLPALYGAMARTILGEFTVTLHSSRGRLQPNDKEVTWRWQTKPDTLVMGAGIKGPADVVEKIPKYIPANWGILAGYLGVNSPTQGGTQ
jgi:hypothetical protein